MKNKKIKERKTKIIMGDNSRVMILFHAVSVYQLLYLTSFKRCNYSNEYTVLLIRDLLINKLIDRKQLEWEFDKVIIYDDPWKAKELEEEEKQIVTYYDQLFLDNGLATAVFDKIFVGCAHNTFGMYLSIKPLEFWFMEDAAGILTRPEVLDEINRGQYALKYELICKYDLIFAEKNPVIQGYLCDYGAQTEIPEKNGKSVLDFCVTSYLSTLSIYERQKLMGIFTDVSQINIPTNSMIILTQHFANLKILSFNQQKEIYQLFIDYFTDNYNPVIKPHPDDLMYYEKLFPGIPIIKEKFPSEFLPFIFSDRPAIIATISSTSTYSLKSCFQSILEMGYKFEKDYRKIHMYYVALHCIREFFDTYQLNYLGVDEAVINALESYSDLNPSDSDVISGKKVFLVEGCDELDVEKIIMLHNNTCIFLDESNIISLYQEDEFCLVEDIQVIEVTECSTSINNTKLIYITNSEQLGAYHMTKELKYSDKTIDAKLLSGYEARIKVLEGICEAYRLKLQKCEAEIAEYKAINNEISVSSKT